MTQNEKILLHMQTYGSITTMEAYEKYGCTRLSARIKDLRDDGYGIISRTETGKNRDGKPVNYSRYSILV